MGRLSKEPDNTVKASQKSWEKYKKIKIIIKKNPAALGGRHSTSMPFKQNHPIITFAPRSGSVSDSEKRGTFCFLLTQPVCPSSLILHLAPCFLLALQRACWQRGRQVFQLVMSAPRSHRAARLTCFSCQLFILLALNDLPELTPSIVGFGSERGGGHGEPQDFRYHVRPEPAHQRGAARGVVGLLVIEEKSIDLEKGERDREWMKGQSWSNRRWVTERQTAPLSISRPKLPAGSFFLKQCNKWQKGKKKPAELLS